MKPVLRTVATIVVVSGLLGILLYTYVFFSETGKLPTVPSHRTGLACSAFIAMLTGFALYYCNALLDKFLSWRLYYVARFVLGYGLNYAVALTLCGGFWFVFKYYFGDVSLWGGRVINEGDMVLRVGILLLVTLFIYNIIYALLYSYQQYAVAQLENLQRERRQMELQFEALKSQLSPHYLFNSLNTVSSLIHKDTPSAEQFVRRLALTYQYILSSQQKKYVALRDEVEFVQSYYYLLRIRFQQQLHVEINIPSNIMDSKIPPLTLQILVENAVKHNSINNENKLFIYITAQDNTYLRVINTKPGNLQDVHSFRVGLENIKKRYAFFTDRGIQITDDDKFTVSLPVIHNGERDRARLHSA